MEKKIPLIVIHGPTASGKSNLAIKLARKFNGEIVSADSRQVYKGLDIGTGKVTKKEQRMVCHHLLDVAKPGTRFTVARFQKLADKAIKDIWSRGKLPFLVGGSPLYVKAVVEGYDIPVVRPDWKLRKNLEGKPLEKLLQRLKKLDSKTYSRIDKKNPRRVIRALEIIIRTGKPIAERTSQSRYHALQLAIDVPREQLYERIDSRVDSRARLGMIREVERLIEGGVSKKWLMSLGLEYRFITNFLQEIRGLEAGGKRFEVKNCRIEMLQKLKYAIHDFARRQMIWYRKMPSIVWIKGISDAEKSIRRTHL
ncbi:MAG: tRNA (adenosine(37)-N6)-dimethylallyltransferase MiaA [Patescibacteria group bacterium]